MELEKIEQGRLHGRQVRPPRHVLTRLFPRRPPLVTPFPACFITSYHFSSTSPTPWRSRQSKRRIFALSKKRGYGRTDGRRDPLMEMRGRI